MKLSIIITTRNRKRQLQNCIESIKKAHLENIDWELIIIDDASSDGTENLNLADFKISQGKIIHNQKQEMLVKVRNLGARNARGECILFIDDDNEIGEDMIEILLKVAEEHKNWGIIGPAMHILKTGEKYWNYQEINFFTGQTTSYKNNEREYFFSQGIPNVFLIRREVFEKVGYFNETLIQTWTEPDFFFKTKKFSYQCVTVNKAKTFHNIDLKNKFRPENLGGDFEQKAYCLMRNRTYIIFQYGKFYHKVIYLLFFSLFWPLIYSLWMLRYGKFK